MSGVHPIHGKVQPYAWGGTDFIPNLIGRPSDGQPAAEYWLGAHPLAPSLLEIPRGRKPLDELIKADPPRWLGRSVAQRYGELPYLLKVLDVAAPLSIQVHPDANQARAGFEREESAGIPLEARERTFKDPNPKPELAVALDDFWLLYGFQEIESIDDELARFPSLQSLRVTLSSGLDALFERIMTADERTLGIWLLPVFRDLDPDSNPSPETSEFWIRRWLGEARPEDRLDRGVLGFLLMNRVRLRRGQAIFQAANVPHAYLAGRVVEIMANSDNVLRCGLTPKHVDARALMDHLQFAVGAPGLVEPRTGHASSRTDYPTPADEFLLSRLAGGGELSETTRSLEIWISMAGSLTLEADGVTATLGKGQALLIEPGTAYHARLDPDAEVFAARVGGG